jgi:hypothetical protein
MAAALRRVGALARGAPCRWVPATTSGPLTVSVCTYSVNGRPAIQITLAVLGTTVHLAAGDTFRTSGCADWHYAG